MRFINLFVVMVWVITLSACSVQKDSNRNTGGDGTRLDAVEIPIQRTIIDNVSYNDGDQHDWKYFRVPVEGLVTVSVAFDNPDAKGILLVRDATGMQKSRLEHVGEPVIQTTLRATAGIYYLEIFVQTERSDYTLEVDFEQGI